MKVRIRVTAAVAIAGLGCGLLAASGAVAAAPEEAYGEDAWWYKAMGVAEAHQESTGEGVTIAVIDSPIDLSVPELQGQDVTAVTNVCGGEATGTGSFAEHASSVVVNIVGSGRGTLPGGAGVVGVAPDATIRVYATDSSPAEGNQCGGKTLSPVLAEAIDAAVGDGADIISISAGGNLPSPEERAALQRALAEGLVVVAAAGNSPPDTAVISPANYPGVVAVAAVDRNAEPWSGNVEGNREAFVISAPGVEVPTGSFDGDQWRSDAIVTGTSEATPLVAGGLALVAAKYPGATGNQLIQHLIRNPGGDGEVGRDLEYGYGIISVPKMLASDPAQWPDVNPLIEGLDATVAAGDAGAPPPVAGGSGDEPADTDAVPVAAAGEDDGGSSAGLLVGGGLVVLLVIGGVVFALTRRRSGGSPAPAPATPAPQTADSTSAGSEPQPPTSASSVPSSDRGL